MGDGRRFPANAAAAAAADAADAADTRRQALPGFCLPE